MKLVYSVNTKARICGKVTFLFFIGQYLRFFLYLPMRRSNVSNRYTIKIPYVFIRRDNKLIRMADVVLADDLR